MWWRWTASQSSQQISEAGVYDDYLLTFLHEPGRCMQPAAIARGLHKGSRSMPRPTNQRAYRCTRASCTACPRQTTLTDKTSSPLLSQHTSCATLCNLLRRSTDKKAPGR